MYRKYINIVEAANKGCPIATRKDAAKQWDINEKTAKTMTCGNCAAFNITDAMYDCIHDGMGAEAYEAEKTREAADLGYCTLLHFKCAGTRSCQLWITGGPIVK
jgi:hypothetical protein